MTEVTISQAAINRLIPRLSSASSSTSRTNLPTILPLAFPSSLHLLNTLTCIHLLHSILAQPTHSAYFAETKTDPQDSAVMGVLGLYLSSDEDWGMQNLLSTAAWKFGKVDEALISEVFRIETTREREHETMKAIRVGGRWEPGARVVEDLALFFKGSAGILGKLSCVGEWVRTVVEDSWKDGEEIEIFAKNFCDWATSVCPSLRDNYETPDTGVLPYLPLRLIHSLAVRQESSSDLDLRLPKPALLEDISPLPLSLSTLLSSGVVDISDSSTGLQDSIESYPSSRPGTTQMEVSSKLHASLLLQSVEACRMIHSISSSLSYLDIHLALQQLEDADKGIGKNVRFIIKDT